MKEEDLDIPRTPGETDGEYAERRAHLYAQAVLLKRAQRPAFVAAIVCAAATAYLEMADAPSSATYYLYALSLAMLLVACYVSGRRTRP